MAISILVSAVVSITVVFVASILSAIREEKQLLIKKLEELAFLVSKMFQLWEEAGIHLHTRTASEESPVELERTMATIRMNREKIEILCLLYFPSLEDYLTDWTTEHVELTVAYRRMIRSGVGRFSDIPVIGDYSSATTSFLRAIVLNRRTLTKGLGGRVLTALEKTQN